LRVQKYNLFSNWQVFFLDFLSFFLFEILIICLSNN